MIRLIADDAGIRGSGRDQVALRLRPVGSRSGQGRLGLRHVSARDLADIEAILGSLKLAVQTGLVVQVQLHHSVVLQHIKVDRDHIQQHILLGGPQVLPPASTSASAEVTCALVVPPE